MGLTMTAELTLIELRDKGILIEGADLSSPGTIPVLSHFAVDLSPRVGGEGRFGSLKIEGERFSFFLHFVMCSHGGGGGESCGEVIRYQDL